MYKNLICKIIFIYFNVVLLMILHNITPLHTCYNHTKKCLRNFGEKVLPYPSHVTHDFDLLDSNLLLDYQEYPTK